MLVDRSAVLSLLKIVLGELIAEIKNAWPTLTVTV